MNFANFDLLTSITQGLKFSSSTAEQETPIFFYKIQWLERHDELLLPNDQKLVLCSEIKRCWSWTARNCSCVLLLLTYWSKSSCLNEFYYPYRFRFFCKKETACGKQMGKKWSKRKCFQQFLIYNKDWFLPLVVL